MAIARPRFGLNIALDIPNTVQSDIATDARQAEVLGFDLVTLHPDHPSALDMFGVDATLESWTALSWIAAHTNTIQFAPSILALSYRHPALIAKMAETLDRLSGNRLILASGAGGLDQGTQAFGLAKRSALEKVEATEEAIDIIRGLWSQSRFSYAGKYFTIDAARIEPRPAHRIPIWLGGHGPRMLDLTGRKADGWLPTLHYVVHVLGQAPETLYEMRMKVHDAALAAGRDPHQITYACNMIVRVKEGASQQKGQIVGSPGEVIEQLRAFLHNGFTLLNIWPGGDTNSQRERIAREILPVLRAKFSS